MSNQTVMCDSCKQKVSPGFTFWDGTRLTFRCPECNATNSKIGHFNIVSGEIRL